MKQPDLSRIELLWYCTFRKFTLPCLAVGRKKEFRGQTRPCVLFQRELGLMRLFRGTPVHRPGVEVLIDLMFLCLFHVGLSGVRGYEPPLLRLNYDTGTM